MTRVQVYDPFAGSGIDDIFRGFFAPVRRDADSPVSIKVDVSENDKGYVVHAEVPGVRKDDIHVTIEGNQVSISAEIKKEKEDKEGAKLIRNERYYGSVSRSFTLAQDVDQGNASAKYSDGVLDLTLPKKAGSTARHLSVA